jgi:hypothetical protein
MDGARPLLYNPNIRDPIPPGRLGERRIAMAIYKQEARTDFHFWAEGESGIWSCMEGYGWTPTVLDEEGKLIADPRTAALGGNRLGPALFFAVPEAGLELRLSTKVRADVLEMRRVVHHCQREFVSAESKQERLNEIAQPYLQKVDAIAPHFRPRLERNLLAQLK